MWCTAEPRKQENNSLQLLTRLEWWVVQDDLAFGLALRAITKVMLSRFARLEPFRLSVYFIDGPFGPAQALFKSVNAFVSSFTISHLFTRLEWWVVQDSNLRPID